jgi:hypothetical protein
MNSESDYPVSPPGREITGPVPVKAAPQRPDPRRQQAGRKKNLPTDQTRQDQAGNEDDDTPESESKDPNEDQHTIDCLA